MDDTSAGIGPIDLAIIGSRGAVDDGDVPKNDRPPFQFSRP